MKRFKVQTLETNTLFA